MRLQFHQLQNEQWQSWNRSCSQASFQGGRIRFRSPAGRKFRTMISPSRIDRSSIFRLEKRALESSSIFSPLVRLLRDSRPKGRDENSKFLGSPLPAIPLIFRSSPLTLPLPTHFFLERSKLIKTFFIRRCLNDFIRSNQVLN